MGCDSISHSEKKKIHTNIVNCNNERKITVNLIIL